MKDFTSFTYTLFETKQDSNGFCLADPRFGRIIWGCDYPTVHLHDQGMLGDIDPQNAGMELYAMERDRSKCWLYSAQRELLSTESFGGWTARAFYWQDGPTKLFSPFSYRASSLEIVRYPDSVVAKIPGRIVGIADCLGDWREELICVLKGEVRIYTTTIPALMRHTCLMQDHLYRMDVAMQTMGYFYPPQLSEGIVPEN